VKGCIEMVLKEDYFEKVKKLGYSLVQFLEEYVNEEGKPKYKEIIDNYVKNKFKENKIVISYIKDFAMELYGEVLSDLEKYNKEVAREAEQMKIATIKILALYVLLRAQLLKGVLGAELKQNGDEHIFITQKILKESGALERITLEELKDILMGHITEINGEQVLVVPFWTYALAYIINNYNGIDLPGRAYADCLERVSLEEDDEC